MNCIKEFVLNRDNSKIPLNSDPVRTYLLQIINQENW